jgi:hypothetical protein
MQNLNNLPSKAMVSLLWSQYNKLSEPLKEGFINLAHSMAEETGNQNISAETNLGYGRHYLPG